ncbi:Transcriptional activator hac1 [Lecanosticta acicola]|uniref:Transcriptional activator hac1 n=1 Tax=Lecanosticta acicola TaxID=111012 RepID=A0AAI9E759_9PEZI|nr:Transcriptional activator hac1 [Lecanosticta acicola]
METTSLTSSMQPFPSPSIHPLEHISSDDNYLKMEDLRTSASPDPSAYDNDTVVTESSPAPVVVQSKPAKKRKSWGQELPEPKTSLPPRKRAKTDDEKEQRRIERIKRNRAAAHNSRERKRQEAENLAVLLAKANAELDAYKKLHGPLPAHIVLPEVKLSSDNLIESATSVTATVATPAPSLVESHGSVQDIPSSPASPADIFHDHGSPQIKQEPFEAPIFSHALPPPVFENLDAKSSALSPLDPTQHSAAMLCDLQCRSSSGSRSSTLPTSAWWTNFFLYLMTLQLQTCYRTLLVAIWALSPSRMARLMQASAIRSTSRSTSSSMTLRISRSTPGRLARRNAATAHGAPRAHALSLDRTPRATRVEQMAARQSRAHQTRMAFSEQRDTTTGRDDQRVGNGKGDGNLGVGRERSLDLGDLD